MRTSYRREDSSEAINVKVGAALHFASQQQQQQIIASGDKDKLKELLRERLIECGWKDELKAQCRAFTRKKGRSNITVDDLVRNITPKGRAMVPDDVKAELLHKIKSFLASHPAS